MEYPLDLMALINDAELGDAVAQLRLAAVYHGQSDMVVHNEAFAYYWYLKAAKCGHKEAQRWVAFMNYQGAGTPKNLNEAARWYHEAAYQGDSTSQYNIGWMRATGCVLERNDVEAVYWYRKAAEQEYALAQNSLGLMYEQGRGGLERSYPRALAWYKKSASRNNKYGSYSLAWVYHFGQGVDEDDIEAFTWCLKSAQMGLKEAQFSVGAMFEIGLGTEQSDIKAMTWYHRARSQGDADAGIHFRELQAKFIARGGGGNPSSTSPKSREETFDWYTDAAEKGDNPAALYVLGLIYQKGLGVPRDYPKAIEIYQKAIKMGHKYAEGTAEIVLRLYEGRPLR